MLIGLLAALSCCIKESLPFELKLNDKSLKFELLLEFLGVDASRRNLDDVSAAISIRDFGLWFSKRAVMCA